MDQASVRGLPADMPQQAVAALEALAAGFDPKEFATALVSGQGRVPRLTVVSRRGHTSQDVYVDGGWFWHSWAERIAAVSNVDHAAAKIADMLGATLPPIHMPQPLPDNACALTTNISSKFGL